MLNKAGFCPQVAAFLVIELSSIVLAVTINGANIYCIHRCPTFAQSVHKANSPTFKLSLILYIDYVSPAFPCYALDT